MDELARAIEDRYVQQWGDMATLWGVPATVGRIHGWLYISGQAATAEELMARLQLSRGGVSMALRTLVAWGLVRRQFPPGQRRQQFVAEQDPWTWLRRVIAERRRQEVEPLVDAVRDCLALARLEPPEQAPPAIAAVRERLERMVEFLGVFDRALDLFLALDRDTLLALLAAVEQGDPPAQQPPA